MLSVSRRRAILLVVAVLSLFAPTLASGPASADPAPAPGGPAVERSAARSTYSVGPRALFSTPGTRNRNHNDIARKIIQNTKHAPAGSTIRGVTWSLSDPDVARALVDAHRRGVRVLVLVGANSANYSAVKYLDENLTGDSNLWIAHGQARKPKKYSAGGAMHQKSWTFSTTGSSHWVSIVTSANVTEAASMQQYNDGYMFVGFEEVYRAIYETFEQQVKLRKWQSPFKRVKISNLTEMWFSPWSRLDQADPVVNRIKNLPVNGLKIRATNAAWSGPRGVRIAQALAAKKRAGARVWVVYSKPFGDDVRRVLASAGIPMQSAHFSDTRYSHSKFMTAEYRANGKTNYRTWLGSENWGDGSRPQDELVVMVGNAKAHRQYVAFFDKLWQL